MNESGIQEMSWQEALAANNGDYAYHNRGGMISHEEDGTYTICTGNMSDERKGTPFTEIPLVLEVLNMSADGWSYE